MAFLILYLLIDWVPCIKNSFVLFRERSWTGIEFTVLLFFLVFYIRQFRHWKPCTPCKQYYLFRLAIVCMSKKFLNVCGGKHMWLHVLIYKDCEGAKLFWFWFSFDVCLSCVSFFTFLTIYLSSKFLWFKARELYHRNQSGPNLWKHHAGNKLT